MEVEMSWFIVVRDVSATLAALAVIIAAAIRYGESIGTWIRKMLGQRWPNWATHVSFGFVILAVLMWFGMVNTSRSQRAHDDVIDFINVVRGQVIDDIEALRDVVTGIDERLDALREEQQAQPQQAQPVEETRERHYARGETNDHCQGARTVRWRVDATDGWSIVEESINIGPTVESTESTYNGVQEVSENGFTVVGRIVNHGSCVRLFGETVARDARGTLRVTGTYTERRILE